MDNPIILEWYRDETGAVMARERGTHRPVGYVRDVTINAGFIGDAVNTPANVQTLTVTVLCVHGDPPAPITGLVLETVRREGATERAAGLTGDV